MLSKFPTQVIIKLEESKGLNDPWTVPKLRQSLQRYITIYTNAQRYEVNSRSTQNNKRPDKSDAFRPVRNFTDQTSAEALVTNTDAPNQRKKGREATRPCIYCKGNHFNDNCQQYSNVSVRRKQLQRQGRCFICLKIGHISKECSTNPVIIVKWLDIIEVFVQQNLQYQRKVVWKVMLTKLMLT